MLHDLIGITLLVLVALIPLVLIVGTLELLLWVFETGKSLINDRRRHGPTYGHCGPKHS